MELHDKGTDRLLADSEKVPECAVCSRPTLGAFGPAPQHNFWRSICQTCKDRADSELERMVIGGAARLDDLVRKSLGLPTNGDTGEPERFSESEGPCDGRDAKGGAE